VFRNSMKLIVFGLLLCVAMPGCRNAAQDVIKKGDAARTKGDMDLAIAGYTEAIRMDSANVSAFRGRGLAYSAKGEWDRAIADLAEAAKLDPENTAIRDDRINAYRGRGNAYTKNGQLDKAVADFDKARRILMDPTVE
jgi:tetratricopeptide (TPR) repeat protein